MLPDYRGIVRIFNARVQEGQNGLRFEVDTTDPLIGAIEGLTPMTTEPDIQQGNKPVPYLAYRHPNVTGNVIRSEFLKIHAPDYDTGHVSALAYSSEGLVLIRPLLFDPLLPAALKEWAILAEYKETPRGREIKPRVAVPGFYGAG